MIHHLHLHLSQSQTVIEFIDGLTTSFAGYYDTLALLVVCALALRLRSVVAFVVLADFVIVYFGQNWLKSLELWGSLGLDYHYTLGIKDTLIALTLLFLAGSPWLVAAYIIPALACWVVWASYGLIDREFFSVVVVDYDRFLDFYHAWSPIYALAMFFQIYGLTRGDSDAGRRVRRKIIPIDWDRVLQPFYSVAYARITLPTFKTSRA